MPSVIVTNKATGEQHAVDVETYSANPTAYELAPGQDVAVSFTEGGPAEGRQGAISAEDYVQAQDAFDASAAGERAGEARRQNIERETGVLDYASQVARGAAKEATLGLSELALGPGTTLEREEEQRQREGTGPAFEIGQGFGFAGTIAATGGTGLLSKAPGAVVGRLAEKAGERLATRTGSRVLGGVAGGAIDAVVSEGTHAVVEELVSGRPFSGEAVGRRVLQAGLFGGAAGGLAGRLGRAADEADPRLGRLADDLDSGVTPDAAMVRAGLKDGDLTPEALARFADDQAPEVATRTQRSWRDAYTPSELAQPRVAESAADVVRAVDRAPIVAKQTKSAIAEILSDARVSAGIDSGAVSRADVDDMVLRTRAAQQDFQDAAAAAKEWSRDWTERAGGAQALSRGKIPQLTDDEIADVVPILSRLDEAKLHLDDVVERARTQLAPDLPSLRPAPESIPATGLRGLMERSKARWEQSKLGQTVTDVAAGAELLGEATGVQPTSVLKGVPVIGDAVSAYLKFRALRNAFSRAGGGSPSGTTARAAFDGGAVARRISGAVGTVAANRSVRAVARAAAVKGSASLPRLLGAPERAREAVDQVRGEVHGLPPVVAQAAIDTAQRAADYLEATRPRDPLADSPFRKGRTEQVQPQAAREYGFRVDAVRDPEGAIQEILMGRVAAPIRLEAVKSVYPELYELTRQELMSKQDEILADVPEAERQRLSSLFAVPLTLASMPTYPQAPSQPPQPASAPGGARVPSPSQTSEMAALADPDQRRGIGRR